MQITEAELCELGVGMLSSIYALKVFYTLMFFKNYENFEGALDSRTNSAERREFGDAIIRRFV